VFSDKHYWLGVRFLVNYGKSFSVMWHWGFSVEIEGY